VIEGIYEKYGYLPLDTPGVEHLETLLGTGGDEVIHGLLDTMYAKAPCTPLQRAMHIHPTVSELIPTLLGELEPLQ
jgi:hypothetical protein